MKLDKNITQGKGVFIFSDPAGSNTVFAIVDFLISIKKKHSIDFLIFTNKTGVFEKKYTGIVERIDFNDEFCVNIQKIFNPDYIFSATSNNNFEHLWRKFFLEKVKTYSFIDHWSNYYKRFHFDNEVVFGDEIWVINKIAKIEAVEEGIPAIKLKIKGNPYYEKVKKYKPKIHRNTFIESINLSVKKKTILFISDDIKLNYDENHLGDCILGYDEYSVLRDVLESLKKLELDNNFNFSFFQFVIKIHPKASILKFDNLIKDFNFCKIKIIKDINSLTLNYYSDYSIGMFSNMVIESYLMNKKLLRVQTGQALEDIMKLNLLKNKVVTNKNELYLKLNNFLS